MDIQTGQRISPTLPVLWRTVAGAPITNAIHVALEHLEPISLKGLQPYALQDRQEIKFIMCEKHLAEILNRIGSDYRILENADTRVHRYETRYFDTFDFAMYHRHHAGAVNRFKVRSRSYLDSGHAFFEVKFRTKKKRMIKNRIRTTRMLTTIVAEQLGNILDLTPYKSTWLYPVINNRFFRITLASIHTYERVTLDLDLHLSGRNTDCVLAGLVIAEVKQGRCSYQSLFIQQMRNLGMRPTGFSKYCMGINLRYPNLKGNRFKSRRMLMSKILRGEPGNGHTH